LLPFDPKVFCVSKTELDAAIEQDAQPALLGSATAELSEALEGGRF
jgi:hypothetical protein